MAEFRIEMDDDGEARVTSTSTEPPEFVEAPDVYELRVEISPSQWRQLKGVGFAVCLSVALLALILAAIVLSWIFG